MWKADFNNINCHTLKLKKRGKKRDGLKVLPKLGPKCPCTI